MNVNRQRQTDRIVEYMQEFGSITQVEAMRDLGVARLASRISDLKDRGVKVDRVMVSGLNRFGEKTSFARYSLANENGNVVTGVNLTGASAFESESGEVYHPSDSECVKTKI